jgi:hypothetical protein
MAQVVQHLPQKLKALSSNLNITKEKVKKEMEMKTTMRYHFFPVQMVMIKKK